MNKIYMIRHGEAAAAWGADADPDLSERGRTQSEAIAQVVMDILPRPVPVFSSPLLRCRSTALPLTQAWGTQAHIEPRVAEIPSPTSDLAARAVWLRRVMAGSWADFYADSETAAHTATYKAWQAGVATALHEMASSSDVVVFSHFIALNVAYGAATDAGEGGAFTSFRPDNASLTIFTSDGKNLHLHQKGQEATTKVN